MPKLLCGSCRLSLYSVEPLEDLSREERLCPKCDEYLLTDRRLGLRRTHPRRVSIEPLAAAERRTNERRTNERRTRERRVLGYRL